MGEAIRKSSLRVKTRGIVCDQTHVYSHPDGGAVIDVVTQETSLSIILHGLLKGRPSLQDALIQGISGVYVPHSRDLLSRMAEGFLEAVESKKITEDPGLNPFQVLEKN